MLGPERCEQIHQLVMHSYDCTVALRTFFGTGLSDESRRQPTLPLQGPRTDKRIQFLFTRNSDIPIVGGFNSQVQHDVVLRGRPRKHASPFYASCVDILYYESDIVSLALIRVGLIIYIHTSSQHCCGKTVKSACCLLPSHVSSLQSQ